MSDVGLYAGLYGQIQECAELLDEVLVTLKAGESRSGDADRERLAELLLNIVSQPQGDHPTRVLAAALQGSSPNNLNRWQRVASSLRSQGNESGLVQPLEELAQVVEQERANTLALMRGWSR